MSDLEPHLLVVDDDARLRELLRRYLSDNGFRVTLAADAAEARASLASFAFDLIVLDVMMPGETGLELTRSLRGETQQQRVPILLLTAMGEPEDRVNGLEQGADDYLAKPFEPRELVLRIRNILERRGAPGRHGGGAGQRPLWRVPLRSRPRRAVSRRRTRASDERRGAVCSPRWRRAPARRSRARICRNRPRSAAISAMSMCR